MRTRKIIIFSTPIFAHLIIYSNICFDYYFLTLLDLSTWFYSFVIFLKCLVSKIIFLEACLVKSENVSENSSQLGVQ